MQRTDEVRPDLLPVAPAPKKNGKAVKIVGIIVGGLVVMSAIGAALPTPEESPAAAPVETPADATDGNESPTLDEPATPTEPEPTTAPEQEFTAGQENAISAAKDYLDYSSFSKSSLIDQLEFEKYSAADARFAVNHITVDWNEQAAKSAQDYLDYSAFSRQGLIDQLEFEGFTTQQAIHGVNTTGL